MVYNPQGVVEIERVWHRPRKYTSEHNLSRPSHQLRRIVRRTGYPGTVLDFSSVHNPPHPTQKPVALMAYLIRTYSNPGDLVLDNTAGSGTTGVAAIETGRRAILIEQDADYYRIMCERIAAAQPPLLPEAACA
jgi:site-specific DNA-methyltransferase (adenine-specific)